MKLCYNLTEYKSEFDSIANLKRLRKVQTLIMILEINEELYGFTFAEKSFLDLNNKVIYEPVTYLFDLDTFVVCMSGTDETEAMERTIVFPAVTRAEAQKAYIKSLNNKKLNSIFYCLNDNDYWSTFWKYFDDGGEKLTTFNRFERYYRIKKIVDWCEENNIPYYINKKDQFIKCVLEDYK